MIIYNITTSDGSDCGTPRVVGRPRSGIVALVGMVGQEPPHARRWTVRSHGIEWWERESDFLAGTCTSFGAIAARVAELLPTVRPEQLEHFERIGPRRKPYTIDPLGNWHELTELGALVLEAAAAEKGPAPKFTGVDWFAKSGDDIFSRADPSDDEDECTWGVFKP